MASIVKKIKKGRPYYYAVQSGRVDGKPRIVWQKYLGTLDAILQRAEQARPAKPQETVIFEAGGVAALARIAQRLGLVELIDEVVTKRAQGPSVGHYMMLAALNRALAPTSKLQIGQWYDQTVLRRLWGFQKSAFSSQRFWDHMEMISEEDIEEIERQLLLRVQQAFGLDTRLLLYDTTNFFTFLATTNERSNLAQRGRNKQKRHDLRQIGLALVTTHDFQIPLFHRVYPGNVPDASLFARLARDLLARSQELLGPACETTLVFDKGNVSDDLMEELVVQGTHFVAALPANRCADLLAAPSDRFRPLDDATPGTKVFETTKTLWGKSCRVVVVYTESFFTQQLQGVTQNLVRCQKKLLDLGKGIERWHKGKGRGRKPTVSGVRKGVGGILSPQFMRDLIRTEVEAHEQSALPVLRYEVDHVALERLCEERLGRTVLVSDHLELNALQVVGSYRGLTHVEEAFKNMKHLDFLRWQPAYHWTDQKLRVHAFYCVMALLLGSLARKIALEAGMDLSLPALLKELSAIREVAVIYPPGTPTRPRDHVALSRMSSRQRKLAELLEIGRVLRPEG